MAIEKTIRDKHEHAAMQLEGLLGIRPPKSPAIYHKDWKEDPDTGPTIYCGQRVVVRVTQQRKGVAGYLLCRIISWADNSTVWSLRTCVYLVAEQASTSALDDRVGQLFHANVDMHSRRSSYYFNNGNEIVSFDPKDMPKRIEIAA